jgi:glutamine cyclotransferase
MMQQFLLEQIRTWRASKVRASDGALLGSFNYPNLIFPTGIAFVGASIWVVSYSGNEVLKLRPSDGALLQEVATGGGPASILFDGTYIWVSNTFDATVSKIQLDGTVVGTFAAGVDPHSLVFDGRKIWVVNDNLDGTNTLTALRAGDGAIVGTQIVGHYHARGMTYDGSHLWVALYDQRTALRLQASNGARPLRVQVAPSPWGIFFDGSSIWVSDVDGSTVDKITPTTP